MQTPRTILPLMTVLIVFLSVFSVTFAFQMTDYLYSGEHITTVTYENFTLSGSSYSLVKVGATESFILKDGNPLTNETDVTSVLKAYYKSKYYPTSTQIEEIKGLIDSYNSSRNDGGRWKGKEQQACRDVLLVSGIIKYYGKPLLCSETDMKACNLTAQMLYYSAPYAEGIRQTMPYPLMYDALINFTLADNKIADILNKTFWYVDNLNDENSVEAFSYIKDSIPTIKAKEKVVEETIFRMPKAENKEDKALCIKQNCMGLCPDLDYNSTKLDTLAKTVASVLEKGKPFFEYKNLGAALTKNTNDRLYFKEATEKTDYYSKMLAPMKKGIKETIASADEAATLVDNTSFKAKLASLKELNDKINKSIAEKKIENLDSDFSQFAFLLSAVKNGTNTTVALYNETTAIRDEAVTLMLLADTGGEMDGNVKAQFEYLKNKTAFLESGYKPGMSPEKYAYYKEAYANLTEQEIVPFMQTQQEFVAFSKFRSFARKVNNGIKEVATTSEFIKPDQLASNAANIPLVISIVSFFAFSSLAMFMFIIMKRRSKVIGFGSIIILLVVIGGIFAFSAETYFYFSKTSVSADVNEFALSMIDEKNVTIALQTSGASGETSDNMKKCAAELEKALKGNNKTVSMSEGALPTSSVNSTSPSFIFKYSQTGDEKSSFSAVFDKKAVLVGDSAYYRTCPIASVFR